jgi:hypothetical protein
MSGSQATLLCLRLDFTLAWMSQNNLLARDMIKRVLQGLREAGVPEE